VEQERDQGGRAAGTGEAEEPAEDQRPDRREGLQVREEGDAAGVLLVFIIVLLVLFLCD